MDKKELEDLHKAKSIICSHCESDMCEWCQVERVVEYAEVAYEIGRDEYIRSSTNGDYSPSAPWSAPGMSIRDFI